MPIRMRRGGPALASGPIPSGGRTSRPPPAGPSERRLSLRWWWAGTSPWSRPAPMQQLARPVFGRGRCLGQDQQFWTSGASTPIGGEWGEGAVGLVGFSQQQAQQRSSVWPVWPVCRARCFIIGFNRVNWGGVSCDGWKIVIKGWIKWGGGHFTKKLPKN